MTEPRLYDEIERQLEAEYQELNPGKEELNLASYKVRALGYSGNEKYRAFIINISKNAANSKLKRHAKKALKDLDQFIVWNKLIADSSFVEEGKNAEVTSYMKMLGINDYFVQRLAARAIFYEHQSDTDLLDLAAEKLEMLYLKKDLDTEWQDTASWLCKAIGQSGKAKYQALLSTVAENTPHRKIKKYAGKYI